MAQLYFNKQKLNNMFSPVGHAPIDERSVFDLQQDLYINAEQKTSHPLYNRAYKGMQVAVFDPEDNGQALHLILINPEPYMPDGNASVTAENFEEYWTIIGSFVQRYVNNVVDPSIGRLWEYVRNTNIVNAGGIDISADNDYEIAENITATMYEIKVKTDDNTIKLINDKLTGAEYKITKMGVDALTPGVFATYKLSIKRPGEENYVDLEQTIDVPKAQILKETYVCKAIYNDGEYTVTVKQNDVTPEEFAAAAGEVYLRMIWETPDDDESTDDYTGDTWLKVSDIISVDITGLNTSVNILEGQVEDIYSNRLAAIDSSIKNDYIIFNGRDSAKDFATIAQIGNMPKGTTIADLESMTISDIIKKILFEVAVAKKTRDMSASIAWSNYATTQEIGATLPAPSNVNVTFNSEIWKCIASDGSEVKSYTLSTYNASGTKYYHNETNSKTGGTDMTLSSYVSGKVVEGTRYVYVDVAYSAKDDAYDTDGTTKRADGKTGTILATQILSYTGRWHMYTNALYNTTDGTAAYNRRNTNPTGTVVSNTKTQTTAFANTGDGNAIYLQWPDATTENQVFHIYVPDSLKIASVGRASNTVVNDWSTSIQTTLETARVNITNSKSVSGSFKDYIVNKPDTAILTVKVVLANA